MKVVGGDVNGLLMILMMGMRKRWRDESGMQRRQWDNDDDIEDEDDEEADEVKWDVEMAVGSVGDQELDYYESLVLC